MKNNRKLVLCIGLSILLSFMLFGGEILIYPVNKEISTLDVFIFTAVTVFICFPLIYGMVNVILKVGKNSIERCILSKKQLQFRWGLFFAIIFGINLVYWIAFNPAIMYADSYIQIAMGKGIRPYDAWQTMFTTIYYKILLDIFDSLTFVVLVQAFWWSILFASIFWWFANEFCHWRLMMVIAVIFSILPNQGLSVITVMKDALYVAALSWITFIIIRLYFYPKRYFNSIRICVEIVVCVILLYLTRLNGVVAALGALISVMLLYKNKRRLIIMILSAICVISIFSWGINHISYIPVPAGSEYMALLNDIQVVYTNDFSVSEETEDFLENVQDQGTFKSFYEEDVTYANNIYNFNYVHNYGLVNCVKMYLDTFLRHPVIITRNILVRMLVAWDFQEIYAPVTVAGITEYEGDVEVIKSVFGWNTFPDYGGRKGNFMTVVLQKLTDLSMKYPAKAVIWRTPLGLFAIALGTGILALIKEKRGVIAFIPIFSHLFSLVLCTVWSNYRYFWPISIAGLMLIFYSILIVKKKGI